MTDEPPVWKRWMIGAGVLIVCAYALWNGAVVPALDGIDTIAEQPTPKCCRICND